MRFIDENTLRALRGSRAGDKVVAYVWRGGKLAYPTALPISSWSFDWDITRQVQRFSCQITDESGKLSPWLLEDPLGVGGSQLQVQYHVGSAGIINMGWYCIEGNVPEDRWRTYIINNRGAVHPQSEIGRDKDLVFVSGGSTIQVSAYDRAYLAKKQRLIAPESPPPTPTVIGEIKRLMQHICPVIVDPGISDIALSRNVVYERERLDAVQDLAKRLFADYRMNGDGLMEIYPIAQAAPVATLEGGPGGLLVQVDRAQSAEGLHNVFVVDGSKNNDDGTVTPIRAVATITDGPLSITNPDFGMVPEFYSSTMIETQEQAEAYAFQMMITQLTGLTVDLVVTCLPQPHLQQGDWVTVANPVVNQVAVPLVGKIKAMQLSGKGAPGPMTLTVQCSYWDVATAMSGVRRSV